MASLFDITSVDIAQLDDAELRELIGRLCEADYRSAGLPTKGIAWGGHQDARDGGLDVVVQSEEIPPQSSYIPRRKTGFQVKKPDMPRAEILNEMRPNGILRDEILSLLQEGGAYIIVSSASSTTATALKNRKDAMHEAVADAENHENLALDFLDRGRVATWVRSHPSLILWVRNKIGRSFNGWQPYENWANAPGGIEEEYILDDGLRLYDGTIPLDSGRSVAEGLNILRSSLLTPGASVRLAGLSGVGKTRLVQALFDERVGEDALNCDYAFYTDISDSPEPDPRTMAEQLIAQKTRAIMVVDNCSPELHRRLTNTCAGTGSTVSLLTIEYDVREDVPEETHVFRLEPASEAVIETLIRKRFSHIGPVDAQTIANFSGGNARLAITLALTVQQGETLSGFRDEELFQRLFRQRHDPNESLLYTAEVCSLVYSFDGEDATSEKSEMKFLASLIDRSGKEIYRDIGILRSRCLVQSRHVWRAVLPHAVANRLAKRALETIPKDLLVESFLECGSERLITSFSRRLSYLHDCQVAVEIATKWLAPDGWLGGVIRNFNAFGMEVFKNIAPVAPAQALAIIEHAATGESGEKFASREHNYFYEFVRLLRHLAYDPTLFKRSVTLLCRYALSEKPEEKNNSTRNVLKSLFYINYSATMAPLGARSTIIEELARSDDKNRQELAIFLLDAALESWHFYPVHEFDFGAWPRSYGYVPKSREEVVSWFGIFIGICTDLSLSSEPIAAQARKILADRFRGLWTKAQVFDILEDAALRIHSLKPWNEGWLAVCGIIRYDGKGFGADTQERLHRLAQRLRPADLLELARTYALSDQSSTIFELEEDCEENDIGSHSRKVEDRIRQIGAQVAQNEETLSAILPDIAATYTHKLINFGRGLAEGSTDRMSLWQRLYNQLDKTLPEKRQIAALVGFLSACAEIDPVLCNAILDRSINDPLLGPWFPILQINTEIDQQGFERLMKALDIDMAPIYMYGHLAMGRKHEFLTDNDLSCLLRKILTKDEGIYVAVDILDMRFHSPEAESPNYSPALLAAARDILSSFLFTNSNQRHSLLDYELALIAATCLKGNEERNTAITLLHNLADALAHYHTYVSDYPHLLNVLAKLHPDSFLNVFLQGRDEEKHRYRKAFLYDYDMHTNPLNQISDTDIVSWCDEDPEHRYPTIVEVIDTHSESAEAGKLQWKPLVYAILEKAPDLSVILDRLATLANPPSWTEPRSALLEKRSTLFKSLYDHDNAEIRSWAQNQYSALQETIRRDRESEALRHRQQNERFE